MADQFEQMEELQQQLKESNSNLNRAALAGKQLLEENQQLAERYDADMDDCNKRIESLEQAKYSLQMHLESKDHMEKHYEAELSNASDRTKREVDAITERLQMTHANDLQKLKSSNDSLKADLDLVKLKETQLQEKIQCLEERLEQAEIGQNRTLMNMTTNMEDQVATLVEQTTQLEVDKLLLMDKLTDSEEICKQQEMTISSSNKRLEELQEIADDRHQQCVSYQRAIEECRERLEEKQAELELFRLESQDPNRKGNSLFAEVEVKRHEIEKKYISLSVQYESAKKRANFHKHRIQELKLQVVNLLQTDDGRVSVNQVKEVQQALVRTRQQNQTLLQKLNESEGTKSAKMPQPHQTDNPVEENNTSEGGLAFLLEQAKKGSDKLRKELKTERMMRMTSETKESEYQVRLNDLKKELDKSKVVNLKMELKISDLREKVKMKGNEGLQTAAKVIKGGNLEKVAIVKRPPVSEVNDNHTDKENDKEQEMTTSSHRDGDTEVVPDGRVTSGVTAAHGTTEDGGSDSADESRGKKRPNVELVGDEEINCNGDSKTKKVSISDDVEVIASDETIEHSVLQDKNSDRRTASPKKSKKARNRVVYVNKSSQNECKQQ